jgi:hypothetical protein
MNSGFAGRKQATGNNAASIGGLKFLVGANERFASRKQETGNNAEAARA